MNWFTSTGTIIYDPHARNRSKDKYKNFDFWWVILLCDQGIVDYNNYWLRKKGIHLHTRSLYGSHVSIVKGPNDEPPDKTKWKARHRKKIEFEYNNIILDNGNHWWIWARSPEFGAIRKELGLDPVPNVKFHLTIGRSKEKY